MIRGIGVLALAACGAHAAAPIENEARVACSAVTYQTDRAAANRLVVSGDRLIAVTGDAVIGYPLAGGAPTTLVTMHVIGDAIVVGDELVYSQYEGGGLYRVPLTGGTPVAFSDPMDGPQAIAPLADGMFAVGGLTGFYRIGRDGKASKFGGDEVLGAASYGGRAYLSSGSSVFELDATDAPRPVFAPETGMVGDLIADDHGLYFANADDTGGDGVSFYDFATGKTRLVASVDAAAMSLAITGGELFAAVGNAVVRVENGAVTNLLDAGDEVVALAAADGAVYYATDNGTIARACVTDAARPAPP